MDVGVECESGGQGAEDRTRQQSRAFDLLVDLCSPAGHRHWIVTERTC